MDAPGLHVGSARRARRHLKDVLDQRARHRRRQKGPYRTARRDRVVDGVRDVGIVRGWRKCSLGGCTHGLSIAVAAGYRRPGWVVSHARGGVSGAPELTV